MRRHGQVVTASGLAPDDHVCWSFDAPDELAPVASVWLREGIDLGQRLLYVGSMPVEELLDDAGDLVAGGSLEVLTLAEAFPAGPDADPRAAVQVYRRRVERAIANGFTGIRAFGEVTDLVRDAAGLERRIRWEQHVDRLLTEVPVSALCAYDRSLVDEDALALLGAVHPLTQASTSFSFHAETDGFRLTGAVEGFVRPQLDRMLRDAALPDDGDVVVDVAELEYASAACTASLHRFGTRVARDGRRFAIRGARPPLRRVWVALGFDDAVLT